MNLLTLFSIELKKIRRTHIFWILLIPLILLWIPAVLNVDSNFSNAAGLSPEMNFFFQMYLGMSWFLYPASLVVITVMLNQLERTNQGILKMLSLPVSAAGLCLGKFLVLLLLSAFQMVCMAVLYYPAAAMASHSAGYDFILPLSTVLYETLVIYISSIPMAAFYWLIAVCIRTSVFSVGIGLATIVPTVLFINSKLWFAYPMCHPYYIMAQLLEQPQTQVYNLSIDLCPLVPVAVAVTLVCLILSCLCFGRSERR